MKSYMLYITVKFNRKGINTYRKVSDFSVSHGNMPVSYVADGRL